MTAPREIDRHAPRADPALEDLPLRVRGEATVEVEIGRPAVEQHPIELGLVVERSRGGLWPYDTETTAMRLGLRRLVLREWLDEGQGEADAQWLESHGLVVARARDRPESGPLALFAARDEATIASAREAHREAC